MSRKIITGTVLVAIVVALGFIRNENSLSIGQVNDNAQTIALLEERIRILSAEKDVLVKENRQLQKDLLRIESFRKELTEDIRWYIKLSESPFTAEEVENLVGYLTNDIIKAIKNFDTKSLARFIHPTKGVCFSASTMVYRSDPVFTREEVSDFIFDPQEYIWGIYSGSGENMVLSPKAYFTEILYNRRFEESTVRFNKVYDDFRGNHFLVYPNSIVVEYFYEGTEEWGFVDTAVLRIVFQQHVDQNWYIVGIIHFDRS